MEYIKHNGLTADEQYPYVSGIDGVDQDCYFDQEVTKPVVKIDDWVMLERNDQYAVMEALVNKGPLIISAYASLWKQYESGVFSGCSYTENIDVNHAIVLMGYGSENGLDYWIVRNSWGTKYGENGHIRVLREDPKCGVDSTPHDGYACDGENDP